MRPDIRWQLLLGLISLALVLSLLSFQAQTAGLCVTRVPAPGGNLVEGMVGAPRQLNPLLSDTNPVDQALVNLVFDGLTRYDDRGRLVPALAREWEVSDDGRTIVFGLRDDATWHDGEPVTARDAAFTYGLMQDQAFTGLPGLHTLWSSVGISVTGRLSLTFTLPQPYGPFLDATTRGLVPAHLLEGVTAAGLADHPFNQTPVGAGPFLVVPGEPWTTSGQLRLAPYPPHWWRGAQLDGLVFRFYPDDAALLAAFEAGEIQAISTLPDDLLPQAARLSGLRLFTSPDRRYSQLIFNLSDSGAAAVRVKEVRQALAHALDRQRLVAEALNGQGLPLEGPYLPVSFAYNPGLHTAYAPQPVTAANLLDGAGWSLPEEAAVRGREGAPLTLRLLAPDEPARLALAQGVAAQWAATGVQTVINAVPPPALPAALAGRDFDAALVEVEPLGDPDLYDFWSQEAIIRGQNYAGWNNRQASEALEAGRQLWNVDERRPFYDAFQRYYDADLPALTLYQHVFSYGLSEQVRSQDSAHGLADVGRIEEPRHRYQTFAGWFLLYRDVTISCPPESAAS